VSSIENAQCSGGCVYFIYKKGVKMFTTETSRDVGVVPLHAFSELPIMCVGLQFGMIAVM